MTLVTGSESERNLGRRMEQLLRDYANGRERDSHGLFRIKGGNPTTKVIVSPGNTLIADEEAGNSSVDGKHEPHDSLHGREQPNRRAGFGGRKGRKRKARNPMGRPLNDPFATLAERYLAEIQTYPQPPSPVTMREKRRKLVRLGRIFSQMAVHGEIKSADPREFNRDTMTVFERYMTARGFSEGYRIKLLDDLNGFLIWLGNGIIDKLKRSGFIKHTYAPQPIEPKDEAWLMESIQKLEALSDSWPVTVVRFATQAYFWCGERAKELRLARMKDFDARAWKLRVSAPKGLGRWASSNDRVAILEPLRPVIMDFLHEREKMLQYMGLDPKQVEPLIPKMDGGFYNGDEWNTLRWKVYRRAGIDGNYRILRSSFGNMVKNGLGLSIEEASRLLRHTNTKTTEKFYTQMAGTTAWQALEKRLAEVRMLRKDSP